MKKILVLFAFFIISTTYAAEQKQIGTLQQGKDSYRKAIEWSKNHPGTPPPLTEEEDYAIFGKDGLPRPGSGVKLIPANKMHYNSAEVKQIKALAKTLNDKGYIDKYNQHAMDLLMFRQAAEKDYAKNTFQKEQGTHLRHNVSDLKIAYDYKEVPNVFTKEIFGFSPESVFMKNGWAGVIEFFKPSSLNGICAYHEINIKLTGGAANFAKEIVTNEINNKITIIEVSGNEASGYEYNIEWWDENFRHILECAAKHFKPTTKSQIIQLSKNIDNK